MFCECGCGQRTKIATKNVRGNGWVKGQPQRFVNAGHSLRIPLLVKLGRKVEQRGECLVWTGAVHRSTGHARIVVDGHNMQVHRLMWEHEKGLSLKGRKIFNVCGNLLCVKPVHWLLSDENAAQRFLKFVRQVEDGCWEWVGALDYGGYAVFQLNDETLRAHRWWYDYHNGPIPAGYQVHHVCRNPRCVNLGHLEALSPVEHKAAHSAGVSNAR